MWRHIGFGFWAIEEKATGRFIGEAGFHELRRDIEPSIEGTLEAGWGFVADAHGKGYATEAVGAALGWGDVNHPGKAMTCIIDPDNPVSIRVAEKHGFRERVRTVYHGDADDRLRSPARVTPDRAQAVGCLVLRR